MNEQTRTPQPVYNCTECRLKEEKIKELEKQIEGLMGENRAYMKMLKIPVLEDDKKIKMKIISCKYGQCKITNLI